MSSEINRYLSTMPNSNRYNSYKQEETKNVLVIVCQTLETVKPRHTMLPDFQKNLEVIKKWDGVHFLEEDIEFRMLLDKVKKDLIQVKTLASI
jgi:hypothetical protein